MITTALKRIRPKLSVREAASRAGISEGWWRQVVRGYQPLKGGGKAPMTGSAETVASMARVVGVTPEQLEEAERPDAAEELRALLAQAELTPEDEEILAGLPEDPKAQMAELVRRHSVLNAAMRALIGEEDEDPSEERNRSTG